MIKLNVKDYENVFPHGEVHVEVKENLQGEVVVIICDDWNRDSQTMIIGQLADIARRHQARVVTLFLPYLPYSRQDRATSPGTAFSLEVFANILNSFNLSQIITYDVHSEVSTKLIKNLKNIDNNQFIKNVLEYFEEENLILVIPDAGATKKVAISFNGIPNTRVQGMKIRDPATGKLSGFDIEEKDKIFVKGAKCLIVDDICSGGGTFLGLKKVLDELGAKSVSLAVTHFDHQQGCSGMVQNFERVFTYSKMNRDEIVVPYKRLKFE